MSKYQFRASEIYLPGTAIPRNRLGVDDAALLQEIETFLLETAYRAYVSELTDDTRFDEDYFKSLHHRTFESLYGWAGEYRVVDMSKGDSLFCRADYLQKESRRIFQQLADEDGLRNPDGWERAAFSARLAYYQCELIALHPFYELNGRITRLFFDLIAIANGFNPIDYSAALEEDASGVSHYVLASISCVRTADAAALERIISHGLTRADAA